ncbi:MAG TPA: Dam family site-specific DNA-(adenine-N6)-methyltransferase, partial [Clostridiales bacterium]|nr:Dam family site-specific DNA-(adenine-N6)-methyltransferase [Clostridiales bacterium]
MRFLRYPGGKSKLIDYLDDYLPNSKYIKGNYIEPFLGGGSVFLYIQPSKSILSDMNKELIDLYKGIRNCPHKVWEIFSSFPEGKEAYYLIRDSEYLNKPITYRAARTLYLNRTCFKGMWRHSPNGNFSVGYGGEERRWVVTHSDLVELSRILKNAKFHVADFNKILDNVKDGDFIFFDPPYKPGEKELIESHYAYSRFTYDDQVRLSKRIKQISKLHKIRWVMTNSNHTDICKLYKGFKIKKLMKGTGKKIG